uniref:Uncharacterized protein n=1 Tax=Anguilla anguilla TaxID=7936 RepID=A0A0E9WDA9_ANGAN
MTEGTASVILAILHLGLGSFWFSRKSQ